MGAGAGRLLFRLLPVGGGQLALRVLPALRGLSARRVLVTHSDGSQSVEEITHDLGVKADDKDEMVKRLKAQGIDVSGVSIAYGDKGKPDKGDKKGAAPPTLSGGRKANPSFQSSFSLAHHG